MLESTFEVTLLGFCCLCVREWGGIFWQRQQPRGAGPPCQEIQRLASPGVTLLWLSPGDWWPHLQRSLIDRRQPMPAVVPKVIELCPFGPPLRPTISLARGHFDPPIDRTRLLPALKYYGNFRPILMTASKTFSLLTVLMVNQNEIQNELVFGSRSL